MPTSPETAPSLSIPCTSPGAKRSEQRGTLTRHNSYFKTFSLLLYSTFLFQWKTLAAPLRIGVSVINSLLHRLCFYFQIYYLQLNCLFLVSLPHSRPVLRSKNDENSRKGNNIFAHLQNTFYLFFLKKCYLTVFKALEEGELFNKKWGGRQKKWEDREDRSKIKVFRNHRRVTEIRPRAYRHAALYLDPPALPNRFIRRGKKSNSIKHLDWL